MKKIILSLFVIGSLAFINSDSKMPTMKIGDKAKLVDYKMKDVNGLEYSINDVNNKNGVCIIFSCNTCPFVVGRGEDNEGWEGRYNNISAVCKSNEIGLLFVNSNEAKRSGEDSYEAMQEHAKENNYQFSYVVDKNSELANAMGAKTTPHVFLFDNKLNLVYEGAIDDNNASEEKVTQQYLNNAMINLVKGEKIDPNNTNALGCSIKRL